MEDKIKLLLKDKGIILDNDQISVVLDNSDKLLVVAGAGSGKTTTMIAKIYYLVKYKKIEEYKILVIAFTNEAVNEIKERLEKLEIYSVNILTFHKLGLIIIEKEIEDIKIVDKIKLLREIIIDLCSDNHFKISLVKVLNKYYNFYIDKIMINKVTISYIKHSRELSNFILFLDKNIHKNPINTDSEINDIFVRIKEKYYQRLELNNLIDFETMITKSPKLILNNKVKLNIDYFFVDEYQDISLSRFLLLKSIVDKFNPKLIAVGDDWQSIYRFAGSKVELFVNWVEMFNNATIKYLNNTYRNSQELINIAGKIVMNNENQFAKKLISNKRRKNPVKIYYYLEKYQWKCLYNILDKIDCKEKESSRIMLLGRYKNDEIILKNSRLITYDSCQNVYRYKRLLLSFFTIHSSKGLGYDEVILLNMKKGKYGFPSEVTDDKITLDLFGGSIGGIDEERRLLYVALTRTKNNVYIMVPYFNKSMFVKEIKNSIKK